MRRKKKGAVLIAAVLFLSISLGTVGFAASQYKTLNAGFGVQVFRNNQQVHFDANAQPFIVNGTTYVPLRAISNMFDKEVGWTASTSRVDINDKPNDNATYLYQQLITKQEEVKVLEAKVAELEAKLKDVEESTKYGLKDLEDDLNYDYGRYESIDFDIDLVSKKNDKIEVQMYINLDYDESYWNRLSSTKLNTLLKNIINDIQKQYKNSDVTGFIEGTRRSSSKNKELASFYLNSRGNLVVDMASSSGSTTLGSLEKNLNTWWGRFNSVDFDIRLYGDKYKIEVDIYVDEYDWNRYMTDTKKRELLNEIYDDIISDFPSAEIYGSIYDEYYTSQELNYFYFSSSGSLTLR